jgi:hypothetical protein
LPKKVPDPFVRTGDCSGRTLALIVSTMRSGSTLLKALLQEAPDVSRLSEVDFQRFARPGVDPDLMWALDERPILLLKRPAWYHEAGRYPRLPKTPSRRVILLVRDCLPAVESLRKMSLGPLGGIAAPLVNGWLARRYWGRVTASLLRLAESGGPDFRLVRYEDLLAAPVDVTRRLFGFLGSRQEAGVASYQSPAGKGWRWGIDDNSPAIRSMTVQAPRPKPATESGLSRLVEGDSRLTELRRRLGYLAGVDGQASPPPDLPWI